MKTGPIEKIYEAYSAIADGRITVNAEEKTATVLSSDRNKTYTVRWDEKAFYSDDSASFWQGYAGYPVIAVLMKLDRLPCNETAAERFSGINWNELNKRFKRDYAKAVSFVAEERGMDPDAIRKDAETVCDRLKELDLEIRRGKAKR